MIIALIAMLDLLLNLIQELSATSKLDHQMAKCHITKTTAVHACCKAFWCFA